MRHTRVLWLLLAAACPAPVALAAEAAVMARDPTLPPAAAHAAVPAPAASGAAPAPGADASAPPRHLMVLNGKPYLIDHGRPHGVGDKLGEARIERIEGGSVWLRDASGLRKVSLYPGVEIRPAKPVTKEALP